MEGGQGGDDVRQLALSRGWAGDGDWCGSGVVVVVDA